MVHLRQTPSKSVSPLKAVVKFVDVVKEAIPGLNMSTVTSHMNMERRGITMKNQGQDGDAKTILFNPEPTAETSISNECLVEEESEVEVP
nr:hypothetical protein [Tanacetum cinerariifolium]